MPSSTEWECGSSSSDSSLDEDQINARLSPHWLKYRALILSKGYRLDTVQDVKEHYRRLSVVAKSRIVDLPGYLRVHTMPDDNALCKDPGLPDNLFRATCCATNKSLMIKAVNRLSREVQNVRYMASSYLRRDPMNHCIPVLDIVDMPTDDICFIVMEEWSSHLLPEIPPRLGDFLSMIRQCIEHIVFMHRNRMTHLDISLHNFLTDFHGRCACIDYEFSQRIDNPGSPRTHCRKGTEVPPELEYGQVCNPYMADVWALAILILKACKIADLCIPELSHLTRAMLDHNPEKRPPAAVVLHEFKRLVLSMGEDRRNQPCGILGLEIARP